MWFWVVTLIIFGHLQDGIRSNPLSVEDDGYVHTAGIGYHKIHRLAKTSNTARSICREEGGDLAIIDSRQESLVIRKLFTLSLPHIGSYDSNYALVGVQEDIGDVQSTNSQNEGLEQTAYDVENCGSIDENGFLNFVSCEQPYAFVCERPENKEDICGKAVAMNVTLAKGLIIEGDEVSIACYVVGYPDWRVLWYKDDDLIQTNDRINISGVNKLIIPRTNKNDTGKYRCEAANEYKSGAHTVDIKVIVPVEVEIAVKNGPFSEGSEISIVCDADGYPTPTVQWYKDDIDIQENERINIVANKLIISTAEKNDAGKYRCEAANEYTTSAETVDIKVASPIKVTIAVGRGPFLKGSQISIFCHGDGYPTPRVFWYKDNTRIQPSNKIRIAANELIISAADTNDTGRYRCEAANEYTSGAETVDIKVAVPVKVKIAAIPGLFPTGSEISIVCNADGYPTPTVQWYKDDNHIQTNKRIHIVANKLIISTAEKNDAGKYRCEATNEYTGGAETVDIKISVPVKVKIAVDPGLFSTGSEISIVCNADGYPTPTVQWYKDDNHIQTNGRIHIVANKLIISTAEKNDAGKYRCEAANEFTGGAETVDVKVVVPVKVKIAAIPGLFPTGSEISIVCNADGYPTPTVQWYKDDNHIQTNKRIHIVANKLIISTAEKNDAGKYRCEAANEYTTSAETVDIKVASPIKVTIAVGKGPFLKGSQISIFCHVDGYPTPRVFWYKDNTRIQPSNKIRIAANELIISAADTNDTGRYRCEAANEYTSGAETVDIKVAVPVKVKIAAIPGLFPTGSEISIVCNADGYPTPTVQWYKDDNHIQTNKRIHIVANKLIISTAEKNDAGKYRCEATNEYTGGAETVDIKISVPVKVKIAVDPGLFSTGSEISIVCNADGYPTPTVQWYKDDNHIQTNGRIHIVANKLIISTAEKNDAGKYRCEATNEYTGGAETVDIKISVPVKVKIAVDPGLFSTGSEISIVCNADGYPTPTVQWYKDDNHIQTNGRIHIVANKLIISTAEKNDAGKYRCEAANEFTGGAETVDVKVVVPVKVKIATIPGLFPTGSEISIVCNAHGYPTPTVQWYKDDNHIQTNKRIHIVANKLIISTAEKNDAGKYRCEAANEYTSSAETVDIKVAISPKVIIRMEEGPFPSGSEISMACNVDGYPTPMVNWYKDGNSIQTNNRITIAPSNMLIISNATRHDTGTYRCVGVNELSRDEDTVDVKVHVPIEVKLTTNTNRFSFGGKVSIFCHVDGYPTPRLEWYKDGNPIRKNDRINIVANNLTIFPIQKNDAGNYSCNAANEYTSRVATAQIIVSVPVKVNVTIQNGSRMRIPPFPSSSGNEVLAGSDISIACNVDGSLPLTVRWYKRRFSANSGIANRILIETNKRIRISASNTLTIPDVTKNDAGFYECEATHRYTHYTDTVYVKVVGTPIDPNCRDTSVHLCKNTLARSCRLGYIASLCCKTCAEMGRQQWAIAGLSWSAKTGKHFVKA